MAQEESPLASLPLLGYTVGAPGPDDAVHKDHVFKLHYKAHFYFFRADTLYAYHRYPLSFSRPLEGNSLPGVGRWMEVIRDGSCNRASAAVPAPISPVPQPDHTSPK